MEREGTMNPRKLIGAAVVATAVIGTPPVALAEGEYTTPPTAVAGTELTRAPEPVKVVGGQETNDAVLPVTGGDLAALAFLGAGAVAFGTVLVRRGRTASVTA